MKIDFDDGLHLFLGFVLLVFVITVTWAVSDNYVKSRYLIDSMRIANHKEVAK